jgi:hypothetical protein
LVPGVAAALLYLALAVYLFGPYMRLRFSSGAAYAMHSVAGAVGCFVLSRRWISSFGGSLFAGAIYGFSPFMLSFAAYHPAAGLPAALLPWMFCPAIYYRARQAKTGAQAVVSVLLAVLPFVAVAAFFRLSAEAGAFFMPVQVRTGWQHAVGLAIPLWEPVRFSLSVYHVALPAFGLGMMMYVIVRRMSVLITVAVAVLLSLAGPVFAVPPVFWLAVPMLYAAVLTGLGLQGLAWAGASDRRWIFGCTMIVGAMAILMLVLNAYGKGGPVLRVTGLSYSLAAVMTACIFFLTRAKLRWNLFRWILLCGGIAVDIIFSARILVDRFF